jgi:hypothetical protein
MAIQQTVTDCWREPLEDDPTVVVMGRRITRSRGGPCEASYCFQLVRGPV